MKAILIAVLALFLTGCAVSDKKCVEPYPDTCEKFSVKHSED